MISRRVVVSRQHPSPADAMLGMVEGRDIWDISRKALTLAKGSGAFADGIEPEEIEIQLITPAPPTQKHLF